LPPGRLAFEGPADDGTDNSLFFGDRTDGEPERPTAVAPDPAARSEAEITSVVGVAAVGRRRPAGTVAANIAQTAIAVATIARSGEEHIRSEGSQVEALVLIIPSKAFIFDIS
jgi:hypothetical protein